MNRNEILKIIYVQKDFPLAEKLCASKQSDDSLLMLARVLFLKGNMSELKFYLKSFITSRNADIAGFFRGTKKEPE